MAQANRKPMSEQQRRAASERMKRINADRVALKTEEPGTGGSGAAQPHPRAIAAKGERRRRKDMTYKGRLKLSLPAHLENDKTFRYYWLADRPGRVEQLTQHDDYDFVTDEETAADGRNTGLGKRIERHAGTDKFGNPVRHFLVRKPIEFHLEDQRDKREMRKKTMDAIRRPRMKNADGQTVDAGETYVPEAGISIQDGYKP